MKVLIDTNVLVSSILNASGTPAKAYIKAVNHPNVGIVCEYNLDELRRIFAEKFPNRMESLNRFLLYASAGLEIVPVPEEEDPIEEQIRDIEDRPILRAALASGADILLTGDKDFLESGIESPSIMTPAQFLDLHC